MDNDNTPFSKTKPIAHIQVLQASLVEAFSVSKAKKGQRFPFMLNNKRMFFSLIKGECDIKRNKDSLLLGTIESPSIVGISDFLVHPSHFIIQAKTAIEYMHFSLDDCLQHVEQHDLWKPLAYSAMYISARLGEYIPLSTAISSYETICNRLRTLNDENFETRATVSAVQYIQERTFLSRSGIMKTLSALNAGGYIVIKRGLLIKINKLPEKY